MSYTIRPMTRKVAKDPHSFADLAADYGQAEDSRIAQVNGPQFWHGEPVVVGARRAEMLALLHEG